MSGNFAAFFQQFGTQKLSGGAQQVRRRFITENQQRALNIVDVHGRRLQEFKRARLRCELQHNVFNAREYGAGFLGGQTDQSAVFRVGKRAAGGEASGFGRAGRRCGMQVAERRLDK